MRKELRRKIAQISNQRKETHAKLVRAERTEEPDLIEADKFRKANKKTRARKNELEQARTYKLLSRGIPSHFYKNLNKSQN